MKVKRYKKARKVLSFFELSFGFREPYKVLMDAEFIAAALEGRVKLAEQVPNFLQGETTLYVTKCIVSDLEQRAARDTFWRGAYLIAKKMKYLRCAHEHLAHPHDCVKVLMQKNTDDYSKDNTQKAKRRLEREAAESGDTAVMEEEDKEAGKEEKKEPRDDGIVLNTAGKGHKKKIDYNAEKLILGIQHLPLRTELRQIPAVPFLHFHKSALIMEDPSPASLQYAGRVRLNKQFDCADMTKGAAVIQRLSKNAVEEIDLHDLHKGKLTGIIGAITEEEKAKLAQQQKRQQQELAAKGMLVKKARAPNPLSCKKRKKRQDPSQQGKKEKAPAQAQSNTESEGEAKEKCASASYEGENEAERTRRKRKRTRKTKSTPGADESTSREGDSVDETKSEPKAQEGDADRSSKKHTSDGASPAKRAKVHQPRAPVSGLQKQIRTFKDASEASRAKPTVGRGVYHTVNNHNRLTKLRKEAEARAFADGIDLNDY